MKQWSDDKLWLFCLQGNRKAFEEVYRRHYTLLYNYGCKLTSDKELVRDTIHNFFIKLITNHKTLSQSVPLRRYLLLAFRNNLFNAFEQKTNSALPLSLDEQLGIIDADIEEEEAMDQQLEIMKDVYKELSIKQQEIIQLFYIKKLSHRQISEKLGINYQSSKNLLQRSIIQLKEKFILKLKKKSIL